MRLPPHHLAGANQRGAAMIVMLVIVMMGITAALISSLGSTAQKNEQQRKTAEALAQAKDALIGYAVTYGDTHHDAYGYLPCPDTNNDGSSDTNQGSAYCAGKNTPVVGRLPWKSLGLPPLRDGHGECLWYAVSGTFKAVAGGYMNELMNWDTSGQFTIQDTNGITLSGATAYDRPVAVIFSAGPPLNTQSHPLNNGQECSGNAGNDVSAYLEGGNAFTPPASPPASPLALTAGNRSGTANNDAVLWITPGNIFDHLKKRSDFSARISALMDDTYFQSVSIAGTKGTGNVICDDINSTNRQFCNDWLEMLFLTELAPPSSITIDGASTAVDCTRALIFGGQITTTQSRQTGAEKIAPDNYLEEPNLAAFSTPTAASANFSGASVFDVQNPSTDLLRCLP